MSKSDKIILFVGSNPSNASTCDVAFHGSTISSRILTSWCSDLNGILMHINVLNNKTENNRPLKKSEINASLEKLAEKIAIIQPDKIVALGKTAAIALKLLNEKFYEMPHPSPRNRQLNDSEYINQKINKMREYCNNYDD
jgi:uracil-DNA glycosylase